ncbi:multidrug ABC transporter ATP-binding protein, partial [Enterococcus faecalis]|nr:multidrug ABC transporter ATP-binding protein [Enterococcus faecalis]
TTLIIAHRLATLNHADRIIVVSDQGILDDGSLETLYAQRGHYRRLYVAQFRS